MGGWFRIGCGCGIDFSSFTLFAAALPHPRRAVSRRGRAIFSCPFPDGGQRSVDVADADRLVMSSPNNGGSIGRGRETARAGGVAGGRHRLAGRRDPREPMGLHMKTSWWGERPRQPNPCYISEKFPTTPIKDFTRDFGLLASIAQISMLVRADFLPFKTMADFDCGGQKQPGQSFPFGPWPV